VYSLCIYFHNSFRVSYTLALCIRYFARRLFIRELLMFGVMNNMKGHASIQDGMYAMNIDGNMIHP
jgi:hypothetical protein